MLAERTYSVWPDLEELMRQHRRAAVHRGRAPAGPGLRRARRELRHRARLHEPADRAGSGRDTAGRRGAGLEDPLVLAGGRAAFNPEPIAEFLDGAVLGDGEQAVLAITELIRDWKRAGRPVGRDACCRIRHGGRRLRAEPLRRGLPARRPDRPGRPEPAGSAPRRGQAHGHGPGLLALPAPAAGAGGRVGARAVQRGDLPRLHPRAAGSARPG